MIKYCRKCGLELPADWPRQQCSSSMRHACWAIEELNEWRIEKGIQTKEALIESFFGSIEQHTVILGVKSCMTTNKEDL